MIPTNFSTAKTIKINHNKQRTYRSQTMPNVQQVSEQYDYNNGQPHQDLFESVFEFRQFENPQKQFSRNSTNTSITSFTTQRSNKNKKQFFQNPYLTSQSKLEFNIDDKVINKFSDKIFRRFDLDNNQLLDRTEIYAAVRELYDQTGYQKPSREKVLQIFDQFDFDNNGAIDILEFRQILHNLSN